MMTSNLGSPSDGSSENLPLGSPQSEVAVGAGRRLLNERDLVLEQVRAARRELSDGEPVSAVQRAAELLADCEQRLLQLETGGGAESDASLRRLQRDNQRLRMQLSRSTTGLLERGLVSVLSCNDDDVVLLLWDEDRRHYRVFQESALLHFVHTESLESLGLTVPPQSGRPPYAIAQVVSHEFCQAKKEGNRYRVPRGTRFYRVRVKPWARPSAAELGGSSGRGASRSSSAESQDAASAC